MRIAHLSTRKDFYGGEVCLQSLATGLRERGHEVSCVVRPDSGLVSSLASADVPVFKLPLVDWFEPVAMGKLVRWLRRERIEILHTHLPRDYYIAAVATLGAPIRNVGTRHHLARISKPGLKRPFLGRFDRMIAVSDAVRREILASDVLPPDRVTTIHNGVEPERVTEMRAADLRRAAGIGADDPVIGCVGRLHPEKGLETVLEAAAIVRERHGNLRVLMLGDEGRDGSYLASLRRRTAQLGLERAVRFCGYQPCAETLAGAFDVQVVASRAEPFGLVTLEAMARGRPVVVTDTGGSPEIVRDGVEGYLFPPGDAGLLARRLGELFDRSTLRAEMGRRGRERVREAFSRDRMLDRTEAVYRAVLGLPAVMPGIPARKKPAAARKAAAG